MSGPYAFRPKGEIGKRFEEERERQPEERPNSELILELIDLGLTAKNVPLYARLGIEDPRDGLDPVGSRLEDARDTGESEAEVVRRFLKEAIAARDEDALDAIGADDDLRAAVEEGREDGEPLDDAVRRLVREGVTARREDALDKIGADEDLRDEVEGVRESGEAIDDAVRRLVRDGVESQRTRADRIALALVVMATGAFPVAVSLFLDVALALSFIFALGVLIVADPWITRVEQYVSDRSVPVVSRLR